MRVRKLVMHDASTDATVIWTGSIELAAHSSLVFTLVKHVTLKRSMEIHLSSLLRMTWKAGKCPAR